MRKVKSLVDQVNLFTKGKLYDEVIPTDDQALSGELWVVADNGEEFFFWYDAGNVADECEVVE